MATKIQATLGHGCAGWYVEWFQEDPTAPLGFRSASWYGSREACEARMKEPPPELNPGHDPEVFTHARAE